MIAILRRGPSDGRIKIVDDNVLSDGGLVYETPDRPGYRGWYGCVLKKDGSRFVDAQGFLVLVWCGWDGEGVE